MRRRVLAEVERHVRRGGRIVLPGRREIHAHVVVPRNFFLRERGTTCEQEQPDQQKRTLREGGGNHQNANSVSILQLAHRISQS